EPQGQPLGQCGLRVLHENPEVRRGPSHRISQPGGCACPDRRVPGTGVQPKAPALVLAVSGAERVRAPVGFFSGGGVSFLRHARSIGPMGAKTLLQFERWGASRWSAKEAVARRGFYTAPSLIVRDESRRLFLGGLLFSRARLRFPGFVH